MIENFETKMDDSYKEFCSGVDRIKIDHIAKEVEFNVSDSVNGRTYEVLDKLKKDLKWNMFLKLSIPGRPDRGYKLKLHDPMMTGHLFYTSADMAGRTGTHQFKISFTLSEIVS
jgi:hypothetical protein